MGRFLMGLIAGLLLGAALGALAVYTFNYRPPQPQREPGWTSYPGLSDTAGKAQTAP